MRFTSSAGLLRVPATALQAHQRRIDVVAHNMSNMGTAGYKRVFTLGSDLGYERLRPLMDPEVTDRDLLQGAGATGIPTGRVFNQGAVERTGRDLDVAIVGRGFLVAQGGDGNAAYTRDGALAVDTAGRVVTGGGLPLMPDIVVPPGGRLAGVSPEGEVLISLPDGEVSAAGRLRLARFVNPEGLAPIGDNAFIPTAASGEPVFGDPDGEGFGYLMPKALERANVDIAEEMVSLLAAQRAYQLSARSIQMADQMLALANGIWS